MTEIYKQSLKSLLTLILISSLAHAQWVDIGPTVYLSNSGDEVGIGTPSPGNNKLRVHGPDNNGSYAALNVTAGGQSMLLDGNEIDCVSGDLYLQYNSQNDVIMTANGGYVGIGTAAPSANLHIVEDNVWTATRVMIENTNNNANSTLTLDAGDGWAHLSFHATEKEMRITNGWSQTDVTKSVVFDEDNQMGIGVSPSYPLHLSSGAYVSSGGVWTNASSRSLKENIRELSVQDAQATLVELTPVTYNYLNDKMESHAGFIAEDVPELVATSDRQGLATMDIVAVLTKVVQVQQAQIENLNARLDALGSPVQADISLDPLRTIDQKGSPEVALQPARLTAIPRDFELGHNYPNPFNPLTTIDYGLPTASLVTIAVYNSLGQHVRTLIKQHRDAGYHSVKWDGKDEPGNSLASGLYIYRMTAGGHTISGKMTLQK